MTARRKQWTSWASARQPQAASILSVCDGHTCIGHVMKRRHEFQALDREGNSVGIFATMKEAADAFSAGST